MSDLNKPALPVRLFQEGFDVWLGNNRGTRLSRKHETLDADEDAGAYWDFSHHEFAEFDVPQMTRKIVQVSNTSRRVSYLGHSVGNMQMFYALGRNSYLQSYFGQVVALSPCFIPSSVSAVKENTNDMYAALKSVVELVGIESLFGPKWAEQLKDLCNLLGDDSNPCTNFKEVPVGPIAGGDITGYSEVGVQQLMHLAQLVNTMRF